MSELSVNSSTGVRIAGVTFIRILGRPTSSGTEVRRSSSFRNKGSQFRPEEEKIERLKETLQTGKVDGESIRMILVSFVERRIVDGIGDRGYIRSISSEFEYIRHCE